MKDKKIQTREKKEERFPKGFLNAIKKLEQEGIIKQTKKDTYKLKNYLRNIGRVNENPSH